MPAPSPSVAAPPRAETERRSYARQACRVLAARAVVITAIDALGADRLLQAEGADGLLDHDTWAALAEAHLRLDELDEAAAPVIEQGPAGRAPDTQWVSVGIYNGPDRTGALHVLASVDALRHAFWTQMLITLARGAATLAGVDGLAPVSEAEEERAACRLLTELTLSVQSHPEAVGGITAIVGPMFDAGKIGVSVVHDERGFLELLPGSFGHADLIVASARMPLSETRSIATYVATTGRPRFTNDSQAEYPLYRLHSEALGVTKNLAVPIIASGRIMGVLHVANKRTDYSACDVARVEPLIPFIAALLQHVRDRLDVREREQLPAIVARAAIGVAAGRPLAQFTDLLEGFCAAVRAHLLRIRFADGAPDIVARTVEVAPEVGAAFERSVRETTVARSAIALPRGAGDQGWAALHTPVLIAGEVKATVSLLRAPYEPFVEHERDSTRRLADVIALGWATERHHRERAQIVRLRERQRIADDLHDHIAQILCSSELTIQSVLDRLEEDAPAVPSLSRARDILNDGQNSIREVIEHLATPSQTTLRYRLGQVVQGIEDEFDTVIHYEVREPHAEQLDAAPSAVADLAVAVAREAMINAAKHANPCEVWVALRVSARGRLTIIVEDNGRGMPSAPRAGHGLAAIRRKLERHGGILRLGRSERGGVQLVASLPLPAATSG